MQTENKELKQILEKLEERNLDIKTKSEFIEIMDKLDIIKY